MAVGPIGAAVIAGGATIASSGINAYSQGKTNRKTRKWNEKMYNIQRENSLADWAMQNEYNSPQAQMQRYRDAGLNPNLIYGQTNEAGPVRSTDAQSWNPRAPQVDLDARPALSAYYDVQLKEASLDNLRTQNTVQVQEALLKAAQTANLAQSTSKGEFDLQLANELKSYTLESAQANLKKLLTDTQVTLNEDERRAAQNSSSLREAAERILQLRLTQLKTREETENTKMERARIFSAIENLQKDSRIKQLDIDLKEKGVQPNDNLFFRVLSRILEGVTIEDIKKGINSINPSPTKLK